VEISSVALQLAYAVRRERLGRRRLADRSGLTEMVVRVELERMRSEGLVRLDRSGVALTIKGKRQFAAYLDCIRSVHDLHLGSLQLDVHEAAAHLSSVTVPPAWMLRDEAIREGATALMLLVHTSNGWAFSHNQETIRSLNPADADEIETTFSDANDEDLLIIVSGPTRQQDRRGLWRVIRAIVQQKT